MISNLIHDYGYKIARLLHWICAVYFIILLFSMPIMLDFASNSSQRAEATLYHQKFGGWFILFLLLRSLWLYIMDKRPVQTHYRHKYQLVLARLNHLTLYFLMIAMPLTGLALVLADGKPLELFGVLWWGGSDTPFSEDLAYYAKEAHLWAIDLIYFVFGLHILGVLVHFFEENDAGELAQPAESDTTLDMPPKALK
ncbi:cytochrome b [Shewanella cyperi]|uniref:Cytochrome b/b6 domain-containing protein n=1 Tax=Shewanella cyperi TaxID=2814292 RepID=A0A974XRW7_9GAMM|nr:cytochrome b/b6 domain-containing protein [Shewanella cyperi]QSX29364.1 cytochrome b/b6 domain-containing protein [Shewanella cyperi]QSX40116.1 cytochrome b/b6 domain-containing protein [Shewanella cyperi]